MAFENKHHAEVSKILFEFSKKGLKAPDDFIEEGRQLAHNVSNSKVVL